MAESITIGILFSASAGAAVEGIKTIGGAVEGMKGKTEAAARGHAKLGDAIKKGTAAGRDVSGLEQRYTRLGASIERAKAAQLSFAAAREKAAGHRAALGGMVGEVMGTVGIGMSLAAPIKQAVDFESAFADVKKVVEETTTMKHDDLRQNLIGLTRVIPMNTTEISQLAAAGAQLGVTIDKLPGFSETVAKMAIAFDMPAQESGQSMAGIAAVYGLAIEDIGRVGDAINSVSQGAGVAARDLVNFTGRAGANARLIGMTAEQTSALGAALIKMETPPEVAARAVNAMIQKLGTAKDQGKDFQEALASLGLSASGLKQAFDDDASGALVRFLERVGESEDQLGVLKNLFGEGFSDDLAKLTLNTKVVREAFDVLPNAGGSMEREFKARAATTGMQLILLKNSVNELGITIGDVLLPRVNDGIKALKPAVFGLIEFSKAHPGLIMNIGKAVAGMLAFNLGMIGLRVTFHSIMAPAWTVISAFRALKSASAFGNVLFHSRAAVSALGSGMTALEGGAAAAGGAVPRLGAAVGTTGATAGQAAGLFGRFGSMLGWIGRGVVMVGGAVAGISAPVWGVIVVVGAALAAVGLLVYKYWQPISNFFSGFWKGFKAGVAPLGGLFKQIFAPMAPLVRPLVSALGSLWEWIKPLGGWFKGLIKPVEDTGTGITELGESVGRFVGQCVAKFVEFQTFMMRLPAQFMEIGGDIIGGLVKGITGKLGEAKEAITGVGSSIKGWFTSTLGISSPSRVFMRFGAFLDEGLALGITNSLGAVTGAVGRLSAAAVPSLPDLGAAFQSAPPRLPEVGGTARSALPSPPKFPDLGGLLRGLMPSMPALPGLSVPPTAAPPNPLANLPKIPNMGNMSRTANSAFHFNPTINLPAAASAGDIAGQVRGAVETGFEEFRKQMRRYEQEMGRRAFGGAF